MNNRSYWGGNWNYNNYQQRNSRNNYHQRNAPQHGNYYQEQRAQEQVPQPAPVQKSELVVEKPAVEKPIIQIEPVVQERMETVVEKEIEKIDEHEKVEIAQDPFAVPMESADDDPQFSSSVAEESVMTDQAESITTDQAESVTTSQTEENNKSSQLNVETGVEAGEFEMVDNQEEEITVVDERETIDSSELQTMNEKVETMERELEIFNEKVQQEINEVMDEDPEEQFTSTSESLALNTDEIDEMLNDADKTNDEDDMMNASVSTDLENEISDQQEQMFEDVVHVVENVDLAPHKEEEAEFEDVAADTEEATNDSEQFYNALAAGVVNNETETSKLDNAENVMEDVEDVAKALDFVEVEKDEIPSNYPALIQGSQVNYNNDNDVPIVSPSHHRTRGVRIDYAKLNNENYGAPLEKSIPEEFAEKMEVETFETNESIEFPGDKNISEEANKDLVVQGVGYSFQADTSSSVESEDKDDEVIQLTPAKSPKVQKKRTPTPKKKSPKVSSKKKSPKVSPKTKRTPKKSPAQKTPKSLTKKKTPKKSPKKTTPKKKTPVKTPKASSKKTPKSTKKKTPKASVKKKTPKASVKKATPKPKKSTPKSMKKTPKSKKGSTPKSKKSTSKAVKKSTPKSKSVRKTPMSSSKVSLKKRVARKTKKVKRSKKRVSRKVKKVKVSKKAKKD